MNLQNNTAKAYFYQKDFQKAFEIFNNEKDYYSAGLCCLLMQKKELAKKYWKMNASSNDCSWGLIVLDIINLKTPRKKPSFFQTRAFLEIYINLFLENNLVEWAQNMVNACDIFYLSNPESYKFIARVLFSNGYFDLAVTFCKKTLKLFYSDPEAFLILSQCYFLMGNLADALDCMNRINAMVDNYYPTILFEKILREEIKKKREENK